MDDPYEVLGVQRDASQEEITSMYKRRAKRAHPDRKGGSHEEMSQLTVAYRRIGDPEARKRFDTDGDERKPPPIEAEAMQLLGTLVNGFLDNDTEQVALHIGLHEQLEMNRKTIAATKAKFERITKRSEVLLKRLNGDDKNILRYAIMQRQEAAQEKVAEIDHALEVLAMAGTLIKGIKCPAEEAAPKGPAGIWMQYK